MCGARLLLVLALLWGFFFRFSTFPPSTKTNISKNDQDREPACKPVKYDDGFLSKICNLFIYDCGRIKWGSNWVCQFFSLDIHITHALIMCTLDVWVNLIYLLFSYCFVEETESSHHLTQYYHANITENPQCLNNYSNYFWSNYAVRIFVFA